MRQSKIFINQDLCHSCHKCQAGKSCHIRAIVQTDPGEVPYIDYDRCYDCRVCITACPYNAITFHPGSHLYKKTDH
jgi:molybdopterin-containing oxidoreductase family iron-sulfur binding subunit